MPRQITRQTPLADEGAAQGPQQPELSGVRLLHDGKDAFAARVSLARSAQRTLDLQYYIWHGDLSGSMMLDEIVAAAERGVRVRLLLDDNGIAGLDARLMAVNRHPRIEVRLFNPFRVRRPKAINWLFDFRRLNRRMHAKSFTADGRATILGGRNIGDEYFGARRDGLFADLDVLLAGPIVPQVVEAFEQHWTHGRTMPAERVLAPVTDAVTDKLAEQAAAMAASDEARRYREAIRELPLFGDMADGAIELVQAPVSLVHSGLSDGRSSGPIGLAEALPAGLGRPERELILISGYFVPTPEACSDLAALAARGIGVRVLTNSFASTDVAVVHAGYVLHRENLLKAGVELFEMPAPDDKPRITRKFVGLGSRRRRFRTPAGSTLHAKAFAIDGVRLYVGSANFDPRSARLNSELGVVIESPVLAGEMSRAFEEEMQFSSYRLALGEDGHLQWTDERDDVPRPEDTEPGTNPISRLLIRVIAKLPIAGLL